MDDEDEGIVSEEEEGLLLDETSEPTLDELPVDNEKLDDELDPGADSPVHGVTGSPTFPCPA